MKRTYLLVLIVFTFIFIKSINGYEISDNVYKIQSGYDSSKTIALHNDSIIDTSNVEIYDSNESVTQKWYIKPINGGYYTISSVSNSNLVFDVAGGKKTNGTNVQLYTYNGTDAQLWFIEDIGNGYVNFVSKCNGLVLDIGGGKVVNGSNIQVYEKNGTDAQKFKLIAEHTRPLDDGYYTIRSSVNNNFALTVLGQNMRNFLNVSLEDFENNESQQWYFEYLNNGFYKISFARNENYSLDVSWGWGVKDNNVQIYENNGTDAQQWLIKDLGNGEYNIISRLGYLNLDIAGGKIISNSNIQTYKDNGTIAQKFKIEPVTEKSIDEGDYYIVPTENDSMVLDVSNGGLTSGKSAFLNKLGDGYAQLWHIEKINSKYYKISSTLDNNMVLDVSWGWGVRDNNVQLYENNETAAQRWMIKDLGNGEYSIISKLDSLYLTIDGDILQNNIKIKTTNSNNQANQRFKLITGTNKTLDNGNYTIKSSFNDNLSLNVVNGSMKKFSNVNIYEFNNLTNQQWNIQYLNNGFYKISPLYNEDLALDVSWGWGVRENNVQLYESNGTAAQQWMIKDLGNGEYSIISKLGYLNLDIAGGKIISNSNIQTYEGNGTVAQKFKIEPVINNNFDEGDYYILPFENNNMALDISGINMISGSNVQLYELNKTWAQTWHVEKIDNNYYKISPTLDNNLALDVSWGWGVRENNVQLYESNGTAAQQWIIKDLGNDGYSLVSKLDNSYLTVKGNSNYSNVVTEDKNDNLNQKFRFIKTSVVPLKDGLYTIESYMNNKAISVNYSGLLEGSSVVLANKTDSNKNKWYIKYLNNGYYSIVSAYNSNYNLGVNISNDLLLSRKQLDYNQQWYIYYKDGNYYIKLKGENLSINSNETENIEEDNEVTVDEYKQEDNEQYTFNEAELGDDFYRPELNIQDGYYIIKSNLSNELVLDKEFNLTMDYTNVFMGNRNNSISQVWYLKKLDDIHYSITNASNRNASLDVSAPGSINGTNIQLYRVNYTDAQSWILRDNNDGTVSIESKYNHLYLDYNQNNNVVINELDENSTSQKFRLEEYNNQKIYKGIDVSSHNGYIDWGSVASSDVDFAIIRLGYGGGEDGGDDSRLLENIRGCEKYNIPYGVYLYSYALNSDIDTTVEIEHARSILSGINPNLGTKVFFDMEDADNWKRRHGIYDDNVLLNTITDKFCAGVESYGYSCGIYANVDWLTNKLDAVSLANKYTIWVAIWPDNSSINNFSVAYNMRPSYNLTSYKYWQFTSNGYIPGINGSVDLNLGYDIFD